MSDLHTKPRIYQDLPLENQGEITLTSEASHYLKNVLRKKEGDEVRIFNGREGEYLATLSTIGKKTATAILGECIAQQPTHIEHIHLLFAPIKKARMDILIEKAVELGVTDFHPVITDRTEYRKLNKTRITAQIIEAAEQCERLNIPTLHPIQTLDQKLRSWGSPLLWAAERYDAPHLSTITGNNYAFLIGPAGGFTPQECEKLKRHDQVTPISLGRAVYRSETAAMLCLAHAQLQKTQ